jgi:hypothetical protein
MILDGGRFRPLIIDLIKNPPLLFLSGFIALIVGILLVVSHNIWAADWRVVITIVAWLSLVKGIIRIMVPQFGIKSTQKFMESNIYYYISAIFTLLIGIFFICHGYFHDQYYL